MSEITRAFYGAYQKGFDAYHNGAPQACPYRDKRAGRYNHIVTFSRAFILFWHEGFTDAQNGWPKRYTPKPYLPRSKRMKGSKR